MEFHLGIEDMEPGNWVAWVFEFPGCYSRGATREDAIRLVPDAITKLLERLNNVGFPAYDSSIPFRISIQEEFRNFSSSPDYLINAFFSDDQMPLTKSDIEYGQVVLNMNRGELLETVGDMPKERLNQTIAGEVCKNISGILRHIGTTEWWYWDRLGMAFPRAERPKQLFELLQGVREFTLRNLPDLVGKTQTTVCSGEQWSPRKLLRRAIWHERVHTLQIARYSGRLLNK
jgi:predicted RNase H-like HicB family nuclease